MTSPTTSASRDGRRSCTPCLLGDQISTIVATQNYSATATSVRVNATELYVFRLRSIQDLTTVIDENSALVDKKTLLQLYKLATEEPYSFLFINLKKHVLDEIFMIKFNRRFRLSS